MSENEAADGESEADPRADEAEDVPGADVAKQERPEGHEEAEERGEDPLHERVEEVESEALAREITALRERAESAEERADELESKLKRKQADFQNFKKRMERKREEERKRATESLVERLLDVRDNLVRALDQDEEVDIRPGVEKTLQQFDRVLDAEEVRTIDPEPGEPVDPQRHEVLMRVESDHPKGTVEGVHRPGYEMADRVLRPAQVTVADEE